MTTTNKLIEKYCEKKGISADQPFKVENIKEFNGYTSADVKPYNTNHRWLKIQVKGTLPEGILL